MALSCGMQCMKYLLLAFNFVFWIAGIAVMSVGIWTRVSAGEYSSIMSESSGFITAANIMIAAGALVMFIGFVGCCGAIKENKCFLLLYFFLLLMIFILEIAGGILAYAKRDKVINAIEKGMNNSVSLDYGEKGKEKVTKAVDRAQEMLKCCGAKGYNDWTRSAWKKKNANATVPESCCKTPADGCNKAALGSGAYNAEGCSQALQNFIKGHIKTLGGIGVGIAIIQILGMVFSLCLFRSIGYEKI